MPLLSGTTFVIYACMKKICLPVFLLVIPWFIRAQDTLDIRYDVNLETMAIIYNLSDAGSFLFEHNPPPRAMLARAITNRFSDLSDHEAVQWVNYLYEHDMVDLYDIDLSLYMTPLPEFRQYAPFPEMYYENDSLSAEEVQAIFDSCHAAVRRFYQDAGLEDFFRREAAPLYKKMMQELSGVRPPENYLSAFRSFYGNSADTYSVIVSVTSFNGIGRSRKITLHAEDHIYQFVSADPSTQSANIDLDHTENITIGYTDPEYFREIAVHELIHTAFERPLRYDSTNLLLIERLSFLYNAPMEKAMNAQGYYSWSQCLDEHLVRLGEYQLSMLTGDTVQANRYLQYCISERGFIYLPVLQNLMEEYINNREMYPDIASFLPVLLDAWWRSEQPEFD